MEYLCTGRTSSIYRSMVNFAVRLDLTRIVVVLVVFLIHLGLISLLLSGTQAGPALHRDPKQRPVYVVFIDRPRVAYKPSINEIEPSQTAPTVESNTIELIDGVKQTSQPWWSNSGFDGESADSAVDALDIAQMAANSAAAAANERAPVQSPSVHIQNELMAQYKRQMRSIIIQQISNHGLKLPEECTLHILQEPEGTLADMEISHCTMSESERFKVKAAVRSQSIPYRSYESVFQPILTLD